MANDIKDPRTLGLQGLKGLKGIDKLSPEALLFVLMSQLPTETLSMALSQRPEEYRGLELAKLGYGDSLYDKEIARMDLAYDINEFRALEQPWYSLLANGALKFLTTTGTTLLDNTIGLIAGVAQGIGNLTDDDAKTGFWSGMWNNDFNNAMADFQEKMEEIAPNYMTHWEQEAAFYERMFSGAGAANFWGNDIMKNAGFTVGTALSLYLTGGAAGALGKAFKIGKALDSIGKAGKFAKWTANTFMSTIGESSLEALNTYRDNKKLMENNLLNREKELRKQIDEEFTENIYAGIDEKAALNVRNNRLAIMQQDIENYKEQMEENLINASNAVLATNIAALAVSNNLTLGSLIRGGYGNAKSLLDKAIKTVEGKPVSSSADIAKGMLKGNLKFDVPQVKNGAAKVGTHWLLTSALEGLEEGILNMASTTALINTLARMNQWAKKNSSLGSMINPDAEEELADITKALGKAYEEQFGSANSQGWTEVAAGFITGALGIGGIHRNKQGKIRPTWQGGLKESYETIYGEKNAILGLVDMLNKALTDGKFGERVRHAVLKMAIKSKQDTALEKENIQNYKNAETETLVADALYSRDMGLLDSYLEMFNLLSNEVSDDDVRQIKTLAANSKILGSAIENLTDDEIKEQYKNKARTTKEKILEALKNYDAADKQYGHHFSTENRKEAIFDITFLNTLLWDTYRRMEELNSEIEELENKSNKTIIELLELKSNKKAVESLQKQANELQKQLNEIKNSPKKLDEHITKLKDRRNKIRLYKEAQNAINNYKEAKTLRDIMEIYTLSPEESREKVLNQAIALTEDNEVKLNLIQFKNYMEDILALENMIDQKLPIDLTLSFDNLDLKLQIQLLRNFGLRQALSLHLNDIIEEMLDDETSSLNRETVREKLNNLVELYKSDLLEALDRAKGVELTEDRMNYDYSKAYLAGELSDDDFQTELNLIGEEETKPIGRAIKMFEAAAEAKQIQDIIDTIDSISKEMDKLDDFKKVAKKQPKQPEPESTDNTQDDDDFDAGENDELDIDDSNKTDEDKGEEDKGKTGKTDKLEEEDLDNNEEEDEDSEADKEFKNPDNMKKYIMDKSKALNKVFDDENATFMSRKVYVLKVFDTIISDFKKHGVKWSNFSKAAQSKLVNYLNRVKIKDKYIEKLEETNTYKRKKNKKSKGKTNTGKTPTFDNSNESQVRDSQVSLNGNLFPQLVLKELKLGNLVLNTESKWQKWFLEQGFNFTKVIDEIVTKIYNKYKDESAEKRPSIYYIHNNDDTVNDIVFIAFKLKDIEDVVSYQGKEIITALNGENYLLIGTLGVDETYRPETKTMFSDIFDNIYEQHQLEENQSQRWFVDTEHTNRLKDISDGVLVKRLINDEKGDLYDLRDLLKDTARNPEGITAEDLQFVVVESTLDKFINYNPEEQKHYDVVSDDNDRKEKTGRVHVYMKSGKDMLVPVYLETLQYRDLAKGTPFVLDISKLVTTLADPSIPTEEKTKAIAELTNDYLLFTKFVNNIHLNDENSLYFPNTIAITHNGVSKVLVDFNEQTTLEENFKKISEALTSLNPRINIKVSTLLSNPNYYLNSGVLRTNIACLTTKGINTYLYPVNKELNWVENKPFKRESYTPDNNTRVRRYLNGVPYYFNGEKFFDVTGELITDKSLIDELNIIYNIESGKGQRIKLGNVMYYKINGTYYVSNNKGGYEKATALENKEIEAKLKASLKKKEAEKIAGEIDKSEKQDTLATSSVTSKPVEEQGTLDNDKADNSDETDKQVKDSKKSTKPVSYNKHITNTSKLDENKLENNLVELEKMSIFAQILNQNVKKRKLMLNALKEKGKKVGSINEILESLKELGVDTSSNEFNTILDLVKNCK